MESSHTETEVNKVIGALYTPPNVTLIQKSQPRKKGRKEHLPKGRCRDSQAPLSM